MRDDFKLTVRFYMGYEDSSPEHIFTSDKANKLIRIHKVMLDKMKEDSKIYGEIICHSTLSKDDKIIAECEAFTDKWVHFTNTEEMNQ